MKKWVGIMLVLIFAAAEAGAQSAPRDKKPLTLEQAYRMALVQSETVAISAKVIDEAQAHFYQSLDVMMPKVNFVMTRSEQDAPESSGEEGVSGSLTRRTTPQKKFVFSQPIFSGFKEVAALQGAGAERRQRTLEWQRAKELLFIDVMEAFYALLEARRDLEVLRQTHQLLEDRIKELQSRADIGRSRKSEVETGVAELKVNEAALVEAEETETVLRQLFEFYIGQPLQASLEDPAVGEAVSSEETYLAMSARRSDVKASEEARFLREKGVVVAQSGLFPSVSLDGNYYTQRVGFQSGIDWDVLLTIDVPVFTGTEVIGNIKEAAALRDKQALAAARAKREAALDVRNRFAKYQAARKREAALREADEALKRNYEIQSEEYRSNLVNNLQVLDALRRSQDVSRQYSSAQAEAGKSFWRLKVAAGEDLFRDSSQ